MYIKYRDSVTGMVQLRNVEHFTLQSHDCGVEGGRVTHGALLCDGAVERTALLVDTAVEYAAAFFLDGMEPVSRRKRSRKDPPLSVCQLWEDVDEAALAWFASWEAAEGILGCICEELGNGGQFFDLTRYGEDGHEK